ncbi:MAG: MFS transporter [Candidatus Dormibacteraceae bacterium]
MNPPPPPTAQAPARILTNRRLLTLMLGHFTVDGYAGLLPVLYPLLIQRFSLDLKTVGLVTLAYTGMASISQPAFGMVADRFGSRLTGLALAWTAIVFSTIGFAPTFGVLVILAGVAGLGSGAFHPLGAINASAALGVSHRNAGMSIYVTGGTLGVALGPVMGALLFALFGIRGTALTVIPGLVIGPWLLWQMRAMSVRARGRRPASARQVAVPLLPLTAVIVVMMSRSWVVFVLEAFIPTWYRSLGYGPAFYAPLATTVVLASAAGTVGSGGLADRFGRRAVIIGALILSVPAIVLFVLFTGPVAFVTGAAVGLLAASTGPLMLVMGQQLLSARAGLASGLVLGLGFVTGAVGIPITGAVADAVGLRTALGLQAALAALTIAVAMLLPDERLLLRLSSAPGAEPLAADLAGGAPMP